MMRSPDDAELPHPLITDHYREILESFKEGICISDMTGTILFLNKSYSIITGILNKEMLSRNVDEFVKRGILDTVLNPEVVATKQAVTRVQKVTNGRRLMLEGTPVFDAKGNVVLCFTVVRDITLLSELQKQITSQKELLEALRQINNSNEGLEKAVKPFVGNSPAVRKLLRDIADIADTDATVLLLGETGVGKDVAAKRIHALSPRKEKIFIKVDCGSIPEQLIETELFGYMPGSFSGSNKNGKIGLIEAAEGGTLFLDEIAELPLHMQTRLLRFLQDREIMRIGSTIPKKVNVRVIAATNKNLKEAVAEGKFRADLYYRINVAVYSVPPLRERKGDIFPMALFFLEHFTEKYQKRVTFAESAKECLLRYKWPGNIREMENLVQRAVITCKGNQIASKDLNITACDALFSDVEKQALSFDFDGKTYAEVMLAAEALILELALTRYGSITEVAKRFGVARSTIFRKIKRMETIGKLRPSEGRAKRKRDSS